MNVISFPKNKNKKALRKPWVRMPGHSSAAAAALKKLSCFLQQ
jgi:hypothetical protein